MTEQIYSPKQPYFLRAFHEWLTDNNFTPYLVVDATHDELVAPLEYANNGTLTLSISYQATHNLHMDNEFLSFSARFGGISRDLWIPMPAVLALFAKENPEHILPFDPSEYAHAKTANPSSNKSNNQPSDKPKEPTSKPKGGSLKIIK